MPLALREAMRILEACRAWGSDLARATRSLRRSPGYALVAIAILTVGLGSAAGMFSVFDAVALRGLPFADADRLVRIYAVPASGSPRLSPHAPTVTALSEHGQEIGALAGQRYMDLTMNTPDGPRRLVGIGVTTGWAQTLGVRPVLGRLFSAEEERRGRASGVALLSYGAWQSRFGGDAGVLGRVLPVGDGPMTIVGVLGRGLAFPYDTEVWFPLDPVRDARGPWGFNLIARRGGGLDLDQLNARLRAWTPAVAAAAGAEMDGLTLHAVPLRQVLQEGEESRVTALFSGVALLLGIVCANVAGLMLTRAGVRQRDAAVRAALGANLTQRLRPALAEAVVIAGVASVLGFLVAISTRAWLAPLLPGALASVIGEVPFDARVVLFLVALGAAVVIACGVLPAIATRVREPARVLGAAARGGTASRGRRRAARALVAGEVALALALSFAAAASFDELLRRSRTPLGYEPDGVVTMTAELGGDTYGDGGSRSRFVADSLARIEALPGVVAAGVTTTFPSPRGNTVAELEVEGAAPATPGERLLLNHRLVSPGFLDVLGVPLVEGRGLAAEDRDDSLPVVVVSRSLARRYFPDGSAIGRRVRNVRDPGPPRWLTIVGVVGDVHEYWDAVDTWYLPYDQNAGARNASEVTIAVRTTTPFDGVVEGVRRAVASVDRGIALFDVATPAELRREDLVLELTATRLSGLFGFVGLAVSALGIYALLALELQRRRREIGIRMALGGSPARLAWTLFAEGARLLAAGLAAGFALLLSVPLVAGELVPALSSAGAGVVGVAVGAIAVAGLAGLALPSLRTGRLDPGETLRAAD